MKCEKLSRKSRKRYFFPFNARRESWWYLFSINFSLFSSLVNFYCAEICLPTAYFTSSQCAKMQFPQIQVVFFKTPGFFCCHKSLSPTSANILSHCPWALQSAATVYWRVFCGYCIHRSIQWILWFMPPHSLILKNKMAATGISLKVIYIFYWLFLIGRGWISS